MRKNNPLFDVLNVILEASSIRKDEELREKSVRFAVTAIIQSVVMVALVLGGAFLLKALDGGDSDALLLFIFVIAGLAACFAGAFVLLLGAVTRVICQLTINRKPIGWIALVVLIAAVAVSIFLLLGL